MKVHTFSAIRRAIFGFLFFSLTSQVQASDAEYLKIFGQPPLETGIGLFGFGTTDHDSDGQEAIVLAGYGGWFVLEYRESALDYTVIHHVPSAYGQRIVRLATTSAPGTSDPVIIVLKEDGSIDRHNGRTFELIDSILTGMSGVTDLTVGDANNDDELDIIVSNTGSTRIFDYATAALVVNLPHGGSAVRVGNTDEEDGNELVTSSGVVLRVNGQTYSVLWESAQPFGRWIELADFDDDGALEIVGADAWNAYRGVDAEDQSFVWQESVFNLSSLALADVTGDDVPEIILGDGQWGSVHAHDLFTRDQVFSVTNPEHSVTNTLVLDSDGDGNNELLWGAGHTSTGPDYLYVYDLENAQVDWRSDDVSGPFSATASGDLDGDGVPELIYASWESDSGYGDGVLTVVDAQTHEVKFSSGSNYFGGYAWTGIHDVAIANVDGDEQPEILVTTDRLRTGALYVIDGLSYEHDGPFLFDDGSPLYAMDTADLNNDGRDEVIAGAGMESTGSPGTYVYAIDASTGVALWNSPAITNGWNDTRDVEVADLDSDGQFEVLAVNGSLSIINGGTGAIFQTIAERSYSSVTTLQYDEDVQLEILLASSDGYISVLDGISFEQQFEVRFCEAPIESLLAKSESLLLLTCAGSVYAYDLAENTVVWSDQFGGPGPWGNNLIEYTVSGTEHFAFGAQASVYAYMDTTGNSIPLAEEFIFSTHWNEDYQGQLEGTDGDADDVLGYQLMKGSSLGQFEVDVNSGAFTFSPSGELGPSTFTYGVSDGKSTSDPAEVSFTVVNQQPSATSTSIELHWRGETNLQLEADDADGDPISFEIIAEPATADVSDFDSAAGTLTLAAHGKTLGDDSLSFRVADSVEQSSAAAVDIMYTNDVPRVSDREYSATGNDVLSGRLLAEDPNGDPLTFEILTGPTTGTLSLDEQTGVFDYEPNAGTTASDSFTFAAGDGISKSAAGQVNISFPAGDDASGGESNGSSSGGSSGSSSSGGGALDWISLSGLLFLLCALRVASARRRLSF